VKEISWGEVVVAFAVADSWLVKFPLEE